MAMKKMNVLIACEESQRVCIEFRRKGHNAYSCDIIPCSGGHPEWHIQGDVINLIEPDIWLCSLDPNIPDEMIGTFKTQDGKTHELPPKWDLIIAFPPCTYMTAAGACRMYPTKGNIDFERYEKALEAKRFFMVLYNAKCEKICIENPRPLKVVGLPKETQQIQPYEFGEPYSKLTYLWLKGLDPLKPTNILTEYKPFVSCGTSRNKGNPDKAGYSRAGGASKVRSKTFWGIARAMAEQWG